MKRTTRSNIYFLAQAGGIAALYVVLTHVSNLMGLASGVIQVRISEALCILSAFTPAAIPGMTIGCFLANLSMGNPWMDILLGTLASFLGALFGWVIRKAMGAPLSKISTWLVPIPTVVANAAIVPFVLRYAYEVEDAWWFMIVTVGAGEIIAAYLLGMILYFALLPAQKHFRLNR